jgi:hypothetical protein
MGRNFSIQLKDIMGSDAKMAASLTQLKPVSNQVTSKQ